MNDLETRLRALRPLPAPRAILDRARGRRRPWLLALAAAAAALAVTAFVVVSGPLHGRSGPASDFGAMFDRLLKAQSLDVEIHTRGRVSFPSGQVQAVERETVLRFKKGNRLHAVVLERQPGTAVGETRIELVSDGARLRDRRWVMGKPIWDKEWAVPADLQRRLAVWLMTTGDLHPVQMLLDTPLGELPTKIEAAQAPPQAPARSAAWKTNPGGFDVTLIYDPAKRLPVGRLVKSVPPVAEGLSGFDVEETVVEFATDEPLDDRLFVLPK